LPLCRFRHIRFLDVIINDGFQNRDSAAIQAKLDELIRAVADAREQFIGIEHMTDAEIGDIRSALEQEAGEEHPSAAAIGRLLSRR
jgi:low affinity Fe/Cu permease